VKSKAKPSVSSASERSKNVAKATRRATAPAARKRAVKA
jgi:hypothetical protein